MGGDLRQALRSRLPMSFGVSGALGSLLYTSSDIGRLIAIARDEGISIFDTSPSYGAGLAESRLGHAIGNCPNAFVMTKAGIRSSGLVKRERDHSPAGIVESVDGSLRRLRREQIDLLWLHGPDTSELTDELLCELQNLQVTGKVGAVGITSRDPSLHAFASKAPFSAYMSPANHCAKRALKVGTNTVYFGVECFANVRPTTNVKLNRSELWKAAKAWVRGKPDVARDMTAKDAFDFAFNSANCDVVLTTTTKASRIRENRALVAEFTRARCAETVANAIKAPVHIPAETPILTMT